MAFQETFQIDDYKDIIESSYNIKISKDDFKEFNSRLSDANYKASQDIIKNNLVRQSIDKNRLSISNNKLISVQQRMRSKSSKHKQSKS